jgi:xanthine dehydrogenase large subunit
MSKIFSETLGQSIAHDSAATHVAGKSTYIDDRPLLPQEVWVGIVGAPVSAGMIQKISFDKAAAVPGFLGGWTGADLKSNVWGTIVKDQPILASQKIGYIDEPIAIFAVTDKNLIALVRALVQFEVVQEKPVFTIDEAIAAKAFLYSGNPFRRGNPDEVMGSSPHCLTGVLEIGGQEHFYLESQACVVYPGEDGQLEVHSSSQHPTETQHVVAHALGLGYQDVTCIVKRMGGAFGGKESQAAPFAAMAALVAKKLQRPARLVLTKDEDMQMTGKRHPFKAWYEVGFDNSGLIKAAKVKLYSDAGAYTDLSPSILDRAMFHFDGAYFLENVFIEAHACRTNRHSNTAFRGFGGPQGNMVIENIMEEIAQYLGLDSAQVRIKNCYQADRKVTPYGQELDHNPLPDLFAKVLQSSAYDERRKQVQEFNSRNCGRVRGLSVSATKFGIAFTAKFLNQGNALVNLHRDGTVQVATGATEMGQGVNTKIQQTVASAFGVAPEAVRVMATSTDKNHNTSPTAASSGADINCAAAWKACEAIRARLRNFVVQYWTGAVSNGIREIEMNPSLKIPEVHFVNGKVTCPVLEKEMPLTELLGLAHFNRISMGELAHFKTENIGFNKQTSQGKPFNYFTNGAAVSEVEIDEDTGEMKVMRVDILMDIGRPVNPAIDRGQITGGFVQGVGWLTTEKLWYREDGRLMSHSPTTYKIPNVQDTPRVFNVHWIENEMNEQAFFKAKAVGEPPLLLGISVWTAIKNAIYERVRARGKKVIALNAPATFEEILLTLEKYKAE